MEGKNVHDTKYDLQKKKYFVQKKKEQQQKERERTLTKAALPPFQPQRTDGPKFTGGGFNLKQPAKVAS